MNRREFLWTAASSAHVAALVATGRPLSGAPSTSPEAILKALRDGNRRFAANPARHPHSSVLRVRQTGKDGQHPRAVVLCCSDSRVAPKIIFDQGIGDLFSVRVAGNVANEDEAVSVEYAVEHLGIGCVVLGHEQCGAVKAVVERGSLSPALEHLVTHIRRAKSVAEQHSPGLHGQALVPVTVRANVWESIRDLFEQGAVLREQARQGRLQVVVPFTRLQMGTSSGWAPIRSRAP